MTEPTEQSLEASITSPPDSQTELKQRLAELETKNAELIRENERLKAELIKASVDEITGLRRREYFYSSLKSALVQELGPSVDSLEYADDEELDQVLKELQKQPSKLHVMAGDMAYLGLINDTNKSHAAGNALLLHVGNAARNTGSPKPFSEEESDPGRNFHAFRHGGDEFSAIIKSETDAAAQKQAWEFQLKAGNRTSQLYAETGLPPEFSPRIDIGTAHFQEAVEVFAELRKRGVEFPPETRIDKLIDTWFEIADRRALIEKSLARIDLLMNLRQGPPDRYQRFSNMLRKGAFNIPDKELDVFIEERKNLHGISNIHELQTMFVLMKLEEIGEKNNNGRQIKEAVFREKVDKELLESHLMKPLVQ